MKLGVALIGLGAVMVKSALANSPGYPIPTGTLYASQCGPESRVNVDTTMASQFAAIECTGTDYAQTTALYRPVPALDSAMHGAKGGGAVGSLYYSFKVQGDPNTLLPLNFSGKIGASSRILSIDPATGGVAYVQERVILTVAQGGLASFVSTRIDLNRHASPQGFGGGDYVDFNIANQANALFDGVPSWINFDSAEGVLHLTASTQRGDLYFNKQSSKDFTKYSVVDASFVGQLYAKLDANGSGYIDVTFETSTYTTLGMLDGHVWVDPFFSIDPSYLAAHPAAQLEFFGGIGNSEISSVPEVSQANLLLAGLFGLALCLHRRRDSPNLMKSGSYYLRSAS